MRVTMLFVFGTAALLAANVEGQFVQPVRATDFLGHAVKDSSGRKLGSVKDLAVDLDNGRIVEVIIASGGFLGLESKYYPVLPEGFTSEGDTRDLRVDFSAKKLQGAPPVDLRQWQQAVEEPRLELAYHYYGADLYFIDSGRPLGRIVSVSRLLGRVTVNEANVQIGRVRDVLVDVPHGRVVEVVVDTARYLTIPKDLSPLPPAILHFDSGRGVLVVKGTRDELFSAPHFRSDAWPPLDREQAASVYQAWHSPAYFLGAETATGKAQTPPTVNDTKIITAPEQGHSNADQGVTAQIAKELLDSPDLSPDAKAVKVSTFNGRVTLRGTVVSEREKRLVAEIAARIVPVEKIDNQLQVRQGSVL